MKRHFFGRVSVCFSFQLNSFAKSQKSLLVVGTEMSIRVSKVGHPTTVHGRFLLEKFKYLTEMFNGWFKMFNDANRLGRS